MRETSIKFDAPDQSLAFDLEINQNQSIPALIRAGSYDWGNPELLRLASRLPIPFPTRGNYGIEKLQARYFNFGLSPDETARAISQIDRHNPWRIAQGREILTFGASFPDQQIRFRIIGLGINRHDPHAIVLSGDHVKKRYLFFHVLTPERDGESCYLGVRKACCR